MVEHIAVEKFREYLRINTVQPNPDYESCTTFLLQYAKELGLKSKVVECVPGKVFDFNIANSHTYSSWY